MARKAAETQKEQSVDDQQQTQEQQQDEQQTPVANDELTADDYAALGEGFANALIAKNGEGPALRFVRALIEPTRPNSRAYQAQALLWQRLRIKIERTPRKSRA